MTKQQIILWSCAYLLEFLAVVYFTRARARRVLGALAGGAAAGLLALGAITLSEAQGWWQVRFESTLLLFYVALSIWPAPVYLVTWRVARRFGCRGLVVFVAGAALVGAPRDYLIAAKFPKWMVFAPGVVPILADAATYVGIVVVGHAVMRLVAGPATEDPLARQPENTAPQIAGSESR